MTLLVPDSSVMTPQDLGTMDGQRLVTACGHEHASMLVEQARRAWVEEQRWFARLCQASVERGMREATVPRLGDCARLSAHQLREALAWNADRDTPLVVLPGGQRLPAGSGDL
ncbi:hypothetical protein [Amycolatopsis sp. FDAARGOS 1241]|uniref:hypothetical protein n=1 Tax=Amycolatopsis sp. FDAARGOS 1241 TaxID=2778070 RepID=UPI0019506632|nr:hypothetical protein [Amycolatopsis sp. FDAARGOS 1241]QRP43009.1 hypothetical protein I6J71_26600 [Amycolatopsis sp. FDAARGOS 1241]